LIMSRREFFRVLGTGAAWFGISTTRAIAASHTDLSNSMPLVSFSPRTERAVVADPADIPPPIGKRSHAIHHEVTLEAREVDGEIEPGAKFSYMTFNGQVPGPMLRVRQGDTITLTLRNDRRSATWHSIDLPAVYGPGGGADPLTVLPGESKTITFKTMYPAAFIKKMSRMAPLPPDLPTSTGILRCPP
jgi:nitrite reductase (NO-forming)